MRSAAFFMAGMCAMVFLHCVLPNPAYGHRDRGWIALFGCFAVGNLLAALLATP